MSILPISRISKELDIIEPAELLLNKRKITTSKLEAFIQQAGHSTDIQIQLSTGSPPDEISSISKKQKANIVVFGNVGRTGLKGLFVGNTAEKILSRLIVDEVIVKQ